MPIVYDIWGNDVEITKAYVSHRNRLIDVRAIHTFQTKGKRLLINTFKQNEHVPTMCIFFDSKETAEDAYDVMKSVYYGESSKALVPSPSSTDTDLGWSILIGTFPLFAIFFFLFAKYLLQMN
jgi:hypothetical protein